MAEAVKTRQVTATNASGTPDLLKAVNMLAMELADLTEIVDTRIDSQIIPWITSTVVDANSAAWAVNHFNQDWFGSLPFSYQGLQKIAQALVIATKAPFPTNDLWANIAAGTYYPEAPVVQPLTGE